MFDETFYQGRYVEGIITKKFLKSLIFKKITIKTTVQYHYTSARMTTIKNSKNTKFC